MGGYRRSGVGRTGKTANGESRTRQGGAMKNDSIFQSIYYSGRVTSVHDPGRRKKTYIRFQPTQKVWKKTGAERPGL